jgi:hypothetical protein
VPGWQEKPDRAVMLFLLLPLPPVFPSFVATLLVMHEQLTWQGPGPAWRPGQDPLSILGCPDGHCRQAFFLHSEGAVIGGLAARGWRVTSGHSGAAPNAHKEAAWRLTINGVPNAQRMHTDTSCVAFGAPEPGVQHHCCGPTLWWHIGSSGTGVAATAGCGGVGVCAAWHVRPCSVATCRTSSAFAAPG